MSHEARHSQSETDEILPWRDLLVIVLPFVVADFVVIVIASQCGWFR